MSRKNHLLSHIAIRGVLSFFVLATGASRGADPTLESPLATRQAEVVLKCAAKSFPENKTIAVEVRISPSQTRDFAQVFDPFLDPTLEYPSAALYVFDSAEHYLGNALDPTRLRSRTPELNDWVAKFEVETTGRVVNLSPRKTLTTEITETPPRFDLPPGKYKVQAVVFDRFVSDCPFSGVDTKRVAEMQRWIERYPGKVVLRSNILEIEVVAAEEK